MRLMQRTSSALAFLIVLGIFGAAPMAFGQEAVADDQRIFEVRTKEGARYFGYLQVDEPERIVLRTPGGATIELPRSAIASITESQGRLVGGEFRPADTNPTRLFFGPTGRALKKGEAYFGVYELFIPFVQVGVTDRLSIGGGTPLIFGGGGSLLWLTPKFKVYEGGGASYSVGAMHFLNEDGFGIAYAAATFGSRDDAFTVALGRAYVGTPTDDSGGTVIMIGGEKRIGRRLKLISENYFVEGESVISGGFRVLGESLSADIGLLVPLSGGGIALPMVNFVWKFR